ncbi:hypothetical protein PUNSTDRAFT_45170 [Punctularia strigosozonata HHB-11173 SS5]|uniref:uncharacterized protein n=1 Tax=Punctularia strigosozonata (strain HHB-11173) TaxID=741275 RepID=UPI00044171EC|nr:uncharacterized protein PUNSTDRAFT_45170 [Punctularia strigosozonata HHB-11173 SS5]EIN07633.1 hypothetical protein PUNSTDRAFT_45170 [Punctularia strigosozonata HHB-11173 SS5]
MLLCNAGVSSVLLGAVLGAVARSPAYPENIDPQSTDILADAQDAQFAHAPTEQFPVDGPADSSPYGRGKPSNPSDGRPPRRRPPPGSPPPSHVNRTVYEFLAEDKGFSKLTKLVKLNNETVDLLNQTSTNITFFAVPNWALPKRPHHRPGRHRDEDTSIEVDIADIDDLNIRSFLKTHSSVADDERKKLFKQIIGYLIRYNTIMASLPVHKLHENTTYATNLTLPDGSLGGEALRVRVDGILQPSINFFSRVVRSVVVSNGIVHIINDPVTFAPPVFQELYAFPEVFATVTSALQHTGLDNALDWRYVGDGQFEGNSTVTFFAPSNRAFDRLPPALKRFLFSALGAKALTKILQLHVVPNFVFHSDYSFNASSGLQDSGKDLSNAEDSAFLPILDNVAALGLDRHFPPFPPSDECGPDFQEHGRHADVSRGNNRGPGTFDDGERGPGRRCKSCWWPFGCKQSDKRKTRSGVAKTGPRGREDPPARFPEHPPPPTPPPRRPAPGSKHPGPGGKKHSPSPPPHAPCAPLPMPHHSPISTISHSFPSLLPNHTLSVNVTTFELKLPVGHAIRKITKINVNGVPLHVQDVPSRNGAVHIVDRLLHPFRTHSEPAVVVDVGDHHGEDIWGDWEDWLPLWASQ